MNTKTIAVMIALSLLPVTVVFAAPGTLNARENVSTPSTVYNLAEIEKGSNPDAPLILSTRVGLGLANGEVNEYVFEPRLNNHKVSQLIWDINNVVMGNLGFSAEYEKWFTVNADFWFGLTDGAGGEMEDYDWLIQGLDWTHYSKSDVEVTSASIIDINANAVFFRYMSTTLSGIIGFKQDNFEFDAKGGTFIYSSYYGYRDLRGSLPPGVGVSYDQTLTSGYLGLGFSTIFSNNLELSGRFTYSPFVQGEATDHHHLRNLVTEDEGGNDGKLYGFDLSLAWFFTRHLSWNFSFSYQKYDTMQDDSTYHFNDEGRSFVFEEGSGMDQELKMLSTALTYTF